MVNETFFFTWQTSYCLLLKWWWWIKKNYLMPRYHSLSRHSPTDQKAQRLRLWDWGYGCLWSMTLFIPWVEVVQSVYRAIQWVTWLISIIALFNSLGYWAECKHTQIMRRKNCFKKGERDHWNASGLTAVSALQVIVLMCWVILSIVRGFNKFLSKSV